MTCTNAVLFTGLVHADVALLEVNGSCGLKNHDDGFDDGVCSKISLQRLLNAQIRFAPPLPSTLVLSYSAI